MIRVLSKPRKNYKELITVPGNWELLCKTFPMPEGNYYFEKDQKEFMYINSLFCFVIPKESGLTKEEILEDTEINIDDWELNKVDNTIPYILNHLKSPPSWTDKERPLDMDISGSWILENKRDNIKFNFSILREYCDWMESFEYYVGFPEKKVVPRDTALIYRKTYFILNLLWKKLQSKTS